MQDTSKPIKHGLLESPHLEFEFHLPPLLACITALNSVECRQKINFHFMSCSMTGIHYGYESQNLPIPCLNLCLLNNQIGAIIQSPYDLIMCCRSCQPFSSPLKGVQVESRGQFGRSWKTGKGQVFR